MNPLDLIPRIALYAAILGLSVGLAGQSWRLHSRTGELNALTLTVAKEREAAASAVLKATEAARIEEQRRNVAHQGAINAAETRTRAARLGAAAARDAGERLREYAASLAVGCSAPASDPPATGASAPATNPGLVLAGLFDSARSEAIRIAALATERGIAGETCVAAYGGLTP
jgi:hypothetical protein